MAATDLIRRLHEHRMWANRRILAAVQSLSREQLQQQFPIGQGSVWRTLTHLYAAEYVWLEAILGESEPLLPGDIPDQLPGNQRGEGALHSIDELMVGWDALESRWMEFLQTLEDDSLDDLVYKISTSSGKGRRYGTHLGDVLLHVCTHAQYTTAQLINMLRQLGVQPLPDVMLISLARMASEA